MIYLTHEPKSKQNILVFCSRFTGCLVLMAYYLIKKNVFDLRMLLSISYEMDLIKIIYLK